MMHSNPVFSTLRWMRLLRPVLDGLVLFACIVLFLYLNSLPHDLRQPALLKQLGTVKTQVQIMAYFQESHASEEAMWASFAGWTHTSKSTTGSCKFEATAHENSMAYHLLCVGNPVNKTTPGKPLIPTPAELPLKHVFVIPKTKTTLPSRTAAPEKVTQPEPPAPTVVQGWMNTPTGRKYFDPVRQRWIE